MKILNRHLYLLILFSLSGLTCFAQTDTKKIRDSLILELQKYGPNQTVLKKDSNTIRWISIETFTKKYYNSAIRGHGPIEDTLTIELSIEKGWDSIKMQEIKKKNKILIDELSSFYVSYMDSIGWGNYKITKENFMSDKVRYFNLNYLVKFSEFQRNQITMITRCPDYIQKGYGIFLNLNNPGIVESDVKERYLSKLTYISKNIFNLEEVKYGEKNY